MSELRKRLDMIANDFEGDVVGDGIINAERMIHDNQFGDPDKVFEAMQEIGTLAEMITNMHHDCDALANAFEAVFRREHGSGKEAATGLDAMKIITEIGNDINDIAPHISWLFEDSDCNIIQNIYNDSFFAPAEGQPV